MLLVGVTDTDTQAEADVLAKKIAQLRVFEDEQGKMNLAIRDIGGAILSISQFTLYADCRKGNRPSFTGACEPVRAEALYDYFCGAVAALGVPVERGVFGADMAVELVNDGPVTILLDSRELNGEAAR